MEIVTSPSKILARFGDEPLESFYYRREVLNQASENLIGRGVNIFENGGTPTQRQTQFLRSADDLPIGGRPSVVREFGRTAEQIEGLGLEFSFLRSAQHRLGMRTFGCVRPRDVVLTLTMDSHFRTCESRLSFCHLCSGYFAALSGDSESIGILDRAQVSTRRIGVTESVSGLTSVVLGTDTNGGRCKRVRTADSVVFQVASKRFRRSDFGLAREVFLEDRQYGNEIVADCKFNYCF